MRSIEVIAKTVELAIEKGLQMLGATEEQVKVNILEKGSMLKKAKIEMLLFESEEERAAEENKEKETQKIIKKIKETKPEKVEKVERKNFSEIEEKIVESVKTFLLGLCERLNVGAEFSVSILDNDLYIKLNGAALGVLIGYHGDTLEATQVIINNIVRNQFPEYRKKIFLDIENYREKRKESLQNLATRMASKVVKNQRSLKLEPMNSFERRIIHFALQGIEHISTHSEGEEPNRYLIIDYVK